MDRTGRNRQDSQCGDSIERDGFTLPLGKDVVHSLFIAFSFLLLVAGAEFLGVGGTSAPNQHSRFPTWEPGGVASLQHNTAETVNLSSHEDGLGGFLIHIQEGFGDSS